MIYAGIGSRETPEDVLEQMRQIANTLAQLGYTLRSGGAPGADTAFEQGCDIGNGYKEIYLPWRGFNGNKSNLYDIPDEAFTLSSKFHPAWKRLPEPVKRLMARNAQQVAGKNLDSASDFVVCWTPDGCTSHKKRTRETGGTGQAISIASSLEIPIYNLKNVMDVIMMEQMIKDL